MSQPSIARDKTSASQILPRKSSIWDFACSRLTSRPLEKSSSTCTSRPSASRRSTRWLPMKPAPPVTRARDLSRPAVTALLQPLHKVLDTLFQGSLGGVAECLPGGGYIGEGAGYIAGLAGKPLDPSRDAERLLEQLHHFEHRA